MAWTIVWGPFTNFFIFNSVGDTIFYNYVGKMSHIFGPKIDIVSEPYMAWHGFNTSTLGRYAISKAIIAFLLGKYFVNISGAMLFFTLNISYARVSSFYDI